MIAAKAQPLRSHTMRPAQNSRRSWTCVAAVVSAVLVTLPRPTSGQEIEARSSTKKTNPTAPTKGDLLFQKDVYFTWDGTIAVLPEESTFADFDFEVNNATDCVSISPGFYTITQQPQHGIVTLSVGDIVVPPGWNCSGKTVPSALAYYEWTDKNSNVTSDEFSLHWATPDGLNSSDENISVISTPHIFMTINGTQQDITDTPTPIPVVVGQQISLTVQPAGAGQTSPWSIQGNAVGGYSASSASGSTTPVILSNPAAVTFYWYTPSVNNVTYSYMNSVDTLSSTSASFRVKGPEGVVVDTQKGAVQIVTQPDSQFYPNPPYLSCGNITSTPCVTFQASATDWLTAEYPSSSLEWVQLILADDIYATNTEGRRIRCIHVPGLDTGYPYGLSWQAEDSPWLEVGNFQTAERFFSAQMYLMWNPGLNGSIFVPLGYIPWRWHGSGAENAAGVWGAPPTGDIYAGKMTGPSTAGYPQWNSVSECQKK